MPKYRWQLPLIKVAEWPRHLRTIIQDLVTEEDIETVFDLYYFRAHPVRSVIVGIVPYLGPARAKAINEALVKAGFPDMHIRAFVEISSGVGGAGKKGSRALKRMLDGWQAADQKGRQALEDLLISEWEHRC